MIFHQRIELALSKSPICIGLDPDLNKLPPVFKKEPASILEFNKKIIDATHDLVGAFKPNFAFYETFGAEGWAILEATIRFIRSTAPKAVII
ncbi:orotidine 5'-phosphate decarboxylase, partial [bacterium]|nr:orotidine 5'-phosphate decarboxylase [bacterium]